MIFYNLKISSTVYPELNFKSTFPSYGAAHHCFSVHKDIAESLQEDDTTFVSTGNSFKLSKGDEIILKAFLTRL